MDSLTHIVLGACIGEAFIGKKFGKRALLLGALAQSIPDIDFIASFWLPATKNLLAHRGITHSLLFGLLITPLMALLADRWRRPHDVSFSRWLWFFGTEIMVHLLLDTANSYGTGLLEPFLHARYSYNALFVADPFFSIMPGIVFIALLLLKSHSRRLLWARIGIAWCSIYLVFACINKLALNKDVGILTKQQHIEYDRYFTTPTPFNMLLWYIVLEKDSGYYIGYRSIFDKYPRIDFEYYPRNDTLLADVQNKDDLLRLIRFSQGYYTVERWGDTLVFNDLRFGQIQGWTDPDPRFVFHYFLQQRYSNDLVVQRGRFSKWNKRTVLILWRRMMGSD